MSEVLALCDLSITVARNLLAIRAHIPELQRLAAVYGQPGTMHGLELLLGSQFARRKRPCLICFHSNTTPHGAAQSLTGAVLLMEYRVFGLPAGVFATADPFGVRTVVGPRDLHATLCVQASRFLVRAGARLVLTTWRCSDLVESEPPMHDPADDGCLYAVAERTVQDTLRLCPSAEETLQTLGKRTRVHMRAARRRFDRESPEAVLLDATEALATASDATLRQLNRSSLDVIHQDEFDHQVRSLCRSPGGFVLGLRLHERWIALMAGWRQNGTTWIEWQCNGRGFEKLSIVSVLRTHLFEEEAKRNSTRLAFHGGTSHSMLHRFQHTAVVDLLVRRKGRMSDALVRLASWVAVRYPKLLQRGNFMLNALCAPGLRWSAHMPQISSVEDLSNSPSK